MMRKNIYVVVLVCALLFAPFNGNALDEQRKFAGHEYDRDTDLSYMGARYYNGGIGRFISQDPAFLAVGDNARFKEITKLEVEKYLSDPQLANSYSYVVNNPLKYTDSQGEFIDTLADLAFIGYDVYKIGQAWYQGESVKGELANLGLDVGGALIPGVTGLGVANRVVKGVSKLDDAGKTIKSAYQWSSISFDASKQQTAWLKGVDNPKLQNIIRDFFKTTDSIPGGTASAIHYTKETGRLVGKSDHIQKGKDLLTRLNHRLGENLNKIELNTTKELINRLDKALSK